VTDCDVSGYFDCLVGVTTCVDGVPTYDAYACVSTCG
jgi:hypothetical protein